MSVSVGAGGVEALGVLSRFRVEFYDCLYARADALFDLTDAALCADRPVASLPELTLLAEHPRGHGAMSGALNNGWLEPVGADNPCHPLRDLRVFMDQPSEPVVPDDLGLFVFGGSWGRVETVWRSLSE